MKSIDQTLDAIYEWSDDLMRAGRLREIESVLKNLRTDNVDVLIGFLTATLPVKSNLPSRKRIYTMAEKRLVELGEFDPAILSGLEAQT